MHLDECELLVEQLSLQQCPCGKKKSASVLSTSWFCCRPEVNQRISKAAHIKELNTEIDKLKEELFATREKNGVYLPADHWESQQVCLCRSQQPPDSIGMGVQ